MSFASPFPEVELPTVSLYEYLFADLSPADAGRIALVDAASGTETSYGELVSRIDAFAGGLAARGIGVGDVVALLSPNSSGFTVAFHGILRAGATATTVNALFTARDIAKQLKDSKARLLVTVNALLPQAAEGAAAAGLTEDQVVVLDGEGIGAPGPAPDVNFDPATHLAALPYSSGTTANPKGVMLTHANLTANVAQIRPLQGMTSDDRLLAVLPFFHIYGMTVLLNAALHARARLVIMPSFDLGEFLGNIATHRCTFAYIAPPVAVALAKHPLVDSYDLSSLRAIMSGAASLDADLGRAVADRLGCIVSQGYGMSELSPVSHTTPHDGGLASMGTVAPLDSCGWTVPNGVSKLVDPDTGDEIGIPAEGLSETGELWFKGPNVMAGYLGNAEATRETIDADGFLHTGDLARVDSTGCVYVVDRLKELIKYKGYQVPPAELEAVLLGHPGIADAAVIGVQDSESGEEVPKAFVVKQPSSDLSADEVMKFVAGQVAPYKKVRQVAFIDAIPKSSAGKILRRELRGK
ncbi:MULTISPECIES: 4-coumarate--CoA ligase family protein [unclassified Mycolicibacterium]|uniref:4-coumarate--CoA ligase family protein n=1 Tax=unclassified Mycolicibacterium TaxID=2636767 RepID=UPI0012DEDDF7|nr:MULTISPECIES: 4-coumarate--CoA ligase family protein [unclassified Mycolicibacterium]MUL80619.1 4-coumarate--CoA ligase family protein [Mycolicibacterium sp. CBMA 329]MUL86386.1 4-coumarate--CoA ligase family protein [Mycolicibacterium sp. CBMA 331]MUM01248.1 4-coumarate--CoA ligase family protein [Mycolicibacterium sp. CBMA 334]MUM36682.1 4-coumarate--CoA ligase family protein [Mycolicibacterium sp. CBMA 247]MUM42450.1 4-coumarate--CoA ligase family protein [Mycolicibacterium sp. CBMA 294]